MAALLGCPSLTARCSVAASQRVRVRAAACRVAPSAAPSVRPALAAVQLRSGFASAVSARRSVRVVAARGQAGAARAEAAAADAKSDTANTLYLGLLFGMWYAANIFFNVWNKQVLKAYTFPITGTFVQFGVGVCIASAMWLFRLKEAPKARRR
jgi:solute carrier family 35 protein E1